MKRFHLVRTLAGAGAFVLLFVSAGASCAEGPQEQAATAEEQAVDEIRPLIELSQVSGTEGMGLEELTEAFSETAMNDYSDSFTGFFMQYPAFLVFREDQEAHTAVSEDGSAVLLIENMPNDGELKEEALLEAIRYETPDAEIVRNEQNGCLRVDKTTGDGFCRTDLYLIAEKSFHHITLRYPAEQKEIYDRYISYMLNTMEIQGSDQG